MRDYSERDVENTIRNALLRSSQGLEFEELRDLLEDMGLYVDGYALRRVLADMVRKGIVCKEVSERKKKLLLRLCR